MLSTTDLAQLRSSVEAADAAAALRRQERDAYGARPLRTGATRARYGLLCAIAEAAGTQAAAKRALLINAQAGR
jgi:hypothetical protein